LAPRFAVRRPAGADLLKLDRAPRGRPTALGAAIRGRATTGADFFKLDGRPSPDFGAFVCGPSESTCHGPFRESGRY
jgi:hypothetical protein